MREGSLFYSIVCGGGQRTTTIGSSWFLCPAEPFLFRPCDISTKQVWTVSAHRAEVTSLDYDGRLIASGAVDGTVRVHSIRGEPTALGTGVQHGGKCLFRGDNVSYCNDSG